MLFSRSCPPPALSVAVMAGSARPGAAERLEAALVPLPVRVVRDPSPGGPLRTSRVAKRAWRPWTRTATHHLVLRDDVELPPSFLPHLQEAVASRPSAVLSLVTERSSLAANAVRIAAFSGHAWVAQPDAALSTVAMVMPVGAAGAFADGLDADSCAPLDESVFRFVVANGLSHFAAVPDLVQLVAPADQAGESGRRAGATVFLPEPGSPEGWWRRPPVAELRRVPVIDGRTGAPASFEAPDAGHRWVLRPHRELWGRHSRRLSRVVQERLLSSAPAQSELRVAAALLGAATVLCDQLLLAAPLGAATGAFAESVSREAAASLVPGAFAQLADTLGPAVHAPEVADLFRGIHDDVRTILAASGAAAVGHAA